MGGKTSEEKILLGEIRGELQGIKELIKQSSDSTNSRINDLKQHSNNRQTVTESRVAVLEDGQKKLYAKSAGFGAMAALGIDLIKRAFQNGIQ